MNRKLKINESLKYFDKTKNYRTNVFKMNKNESFNHRFAKFLICDELLKNDIQFVTEAVFANGKRADIFDLVNCEAIEVIESEKEESITKKRECYPVRLRVMKADEVINFWANKVFR